MESANDVCTKDWKDFEEYTHHKTKANKQWLTPNPSIEETRLERSKYWEYSSRFVLCCVVIIVHSSSLKQQDLDTVIIIKVSTQRKHSIKAVASHSSRNYFWMANHSFQCGTNMSPKHYIQRDEQQKETLLTSFRNPHCNAFQSPSSLSIRAFIFCMICCVIFSLFSTSGVSCFELYFYGFR